MGQLFEFDRGSNWSEQVMGTNTGAAAVLLKRPVQFYGYENYCRIAAHSCSSSAPIFDEDGKVCGVIGVAGPYHLVNRHTLGMVVAASRAIERHMALQTSYQNSEMANLHKTAIMESMSEGVLTLDRAGRITHSTELPPAIWESITRPGRSKAGRPMSPATSCSSPGYQATKGLPENPAYKTRQHYRQTCGQLHAFDRQKRKDPGNSHYSSTNETLQAPY